MYAQLKDSYNWENLNRDGAIVNKMTDILERGEILSPQRIPTALLVLKNRIKGPLTSAVLKELEIGNIEMVYAPKLKMPLYLPFFMVQVSPHTVKGYVVVNNFDPMDTGTELNLDARKLKVALESCYIAMKSNDMGDSPKLKSTTIVRTGSKIHSAIVTECINRKHSIKLDSRVYNAVMYLDSKYFIKTVLGANFNKETLENYCLYNCKEPDLIHLRKIDEMFVDEDFKNIGTLIKKISEVPEFKGRLGKLTVSNFLESYLNMYDSSMLLALEVFPYFFYNVLAVVDSTYINNYAILKNIIGDDGKKLYADLAVALG